MKSPLLLLGIAGAAYLATKKKPVTTKSTKPEVKLPGIEIDPEKKLPEVDDDLKDLPQVDDDKPDTEDAEETEDKIDLSVFYDPFLQKGNQSPLVMDSESIWISDDCLSWAVGKDYKVTLPEKYLYVDPLNENQLTTPWQWWNKIGGTMSPSPWYLNDLPSDSPPRAFAANLIDYWNKCDISAPRRKQFKTYNEYRFVFDKFLTTPLGKLMEYLVGRIRTEMYNGWENKYPNEAMLETYKGWALQAIVQFPKKTIDEQTSIAYHNAFEGNPDAPYKIDPKNPAHKPYVSAWMRINIEVKNYQGLIKQYGL